MNNRDIIYTKNDLNTYDYFCDFASQVYYEENPSNTKVCFDDLKISKFNSTELDKSIFLSVSNEYLIAIKNFSNVFNSLIKYGRDHRGLMKLFDGNEISTIPQLDSLIEPILDLLLPIIEREIVGFYLSPWYIGAQRTPVRPPNPIDDNTSWQWHYDAVPRGTFKLFIYLSDVDEESAPFTILTDQSGAPVLRDANDWKYITKDEKNHNQINEKRGIESRIPQKEIDALKSQGYNEVGVHLPAGSFLVWNVNHIHKATAGKKRHRDILMIQLRPTHKKPESYWYGSNARQHATKWLMDWWEMDKKLHR